MWIWYMHVFPFSNGGINKVAVVVTSLRFQILLELQAPAKHQPLLNFFFQVFIELGINNFGCV